MSDSSKKGNDPASVLRAEEATVTAILQSKLTAHDCLRESDRQLVAYRVAEIMVGAKELYTKDLPKIIADSGHPAEADVFGELAGLRMAFLHIRDLITDFDEAFMVAMSHQREDDDEDEDDDTEDQAQESLLDDEEE